MSNAPNAYAAPLAPRFRVEAAADGGQRIVVPARRSLFLMAFLTVWLAGWSFGGAAAMARMWADFSPFLAFWLCGWALGEAGVIATLAWMAAGRETIRAAGADLEISAELLGFVRRRLYRGAHIHNLSAAGSPELFARRRLDNPMLWAPASGGVKFVYGARTVYAGVGLDEAEGAMIVDLLKRRLPKGAAAGG
ncbi:MAG: hypothetical protein KGM15_04335 [Pseudomonadota bacterium]|nr:hypothetical protein [Pseudomonadota bacterium]